MSGVGDSKKFIVSLRADPRDDETQIFYADICPTFSSSGMGQKELYGKNFLDTYLVDSATGGIYLEVDPNGADDLGFSSERQSLAMMYYASVGDCERYVRARDFAEEYMLTSDNVLCWLMNPNYTCTSQGAASIDDLKALEAMAVAHEQFNNPYDLVFAQKLSSGLQTNCTYTDSATDLTYFTDCYDSYLPLCYGNLPGMTEVSSLGSSFSNWSNIMTNTISVLTTGSLGNGLFKFGYDYETDTYDTYEPTLTTLNTIQEALIGLNLIYADEDLARLNLAFWEDAWAMYPSYPRVEGQFYADGTPASYFGADVSAHAIIGQLAYFLGEEAFCETMVGEQAIPAQNYGTNMYGFSFSSSGPISSYGQLHTLIALSMCEPVATEQFELDVLE